MTLDPNLRRQRSERAATIRHLNGIAMAAQKLGRFDECARAIVLAQRIDRLRRNPRLTGRGKHSIYLQIMREAAK